MKNTILIFILSVFTMLSSQASADKTESDKNMKSYKTFGTMGKEQRPLSKSEEAVLLEYEGKGCLTHMWFGGDFKSFGQTRLRIYVDGEKTASIDMKLYLGHGIGFNDPGPPWGTDRIGITGHQGGLYNTYRIPFGSKIRVTAQLSDSEEQTRPLFWWIVRGTENLPIELGGVELPDNARLKLYTRENYTAGRLEEIDLCTTRKNGALYQVTICAKSTNLNYLESCVRAYTGKNSELLWLSSGLEDYFLGTYYFQTGKYYTPIAGLTHFSKKENSFCAYRFHEVDPVFFEDGLRLTVRCGEKIEDKVFHNPQPTTFWTYTWVYEW